MRYDDDFVCGVAVSQGLDRGRGAAGDAIDRLGRIRRFGEPFVGKAFECREVALVEAGNWFGRETQNAADDFAGLPRPEEMGRDQDLGLEFASEALREPFGLAAASFTQGDVVICEDPALVRGSFAMTDKDEAARGHLS